MPLPKNNNAKKIFFSGLTNKEQAILKRLSTPAKIQDYLDSLKMNFSENDPCFCPRDVLREQKAHCMEGALLAAAALWYHGEKPLLLDLTTTNDDEDHVITLFKVNEYWGAISKTNHAVLRYRDPIYKTIRELVLSYFHEYFLNSGKKTLRTFSQPFDLSKLYKLDWFKSRDGILDLIDQLASSPHEQIIANEQTKILRRADEIEIQAGKLVEWKPRK
jgi:hypothetical protein